MSLPSFRAFAEAVSLPMSANIFLLWVGMGFGIYADTHDVLDVRDLTLLYRAMLVPLIISVYLRLYIVIHDRKANK